MELQEIANQVVRGLAAQGWQESVDDEANCRYRGNNGCRCPVGHVIPDEEYKECFEGEAVILDSENIKKHHLFNHYLRGKFNYFTIRFLSKLQRAHDFTMLEMPMKESMKERVKSVLAEYDLSWPSDVPLD